MGRGSSGASGVTNEYGRSGVPTVSYDKWGKTLEGSNIKTLYDDEGNVIGQIEDERIYVSEEDYSKITKKDILNAIDGWRNDDGSYGDQDTSIMLFYDDGTSKSIDVNWSDSKKRYKKSGIIGASLSTADDEWAWGDEWVTKNGKKIHTPIQTWSEDGESGRTNTWAGYKTTGVYIARVKTTYNNKRADGRYYMKREWLRKSTVKKI